MSKILKVIETLQKSGLRGVTNKFNERKSLRKQAETYQNWVNKFDTLSEKDRQTIKQKSDNLPSKPLISIVLPVYNVDEKWLRLCIESVFKQIYPNWELCIADDCSPKPHIRKVLEEFTAKDSRIKIIFRTENGHISAASNSALNLAKGEFTALLDHDDELSEHALFFVANEINKFPEAQMIYSDEDMVDENGNRYQPKFKPDFSLDLLYSLNLVTHLAVYRTDVLRKIGGFRVGLEGSQDYDLALRFIEQIPKKNIRHIPHILYHWRAILGSVALSADQKSYAHSRARQAIKKYLQSKNISAEVVEGFESWHRVIYDLPKETFISIISTENVTANHTNIEFIQVGNISAKSLNVAAQKAKGDVLIFVENSIKPFSNDWMTELASFATQTEIGAVGGKIFFPDKKIRHNGIIGGIDESVGFAFRNLSRNDFSGLGRTQVINNFSAVSGVLAVRRELFNGLQGFDEINFDKGLFDIDFCWRLREKNYRIVFTPYAKFVQTLDSTAEKKLQNKDSAEMNVFKSKWQKFIENDEFYNPNLSLENGGFSVAIPPRFLKPWED